MAPLMVNVLPVTMPLNPESGVFPLLNVNDPEKVAVPVPLSVPPATATIGLVVEPIVGLFPSGMVQPVLTVFVPEVWANVTRLNVMLLHVSVAETAPSKATVPPLALKVGVPETDKVESTVIVSEEALNVPPDRVKAPVSNSWLPAVKVAPLCVKNVV